MKTGYLILLQLVIFFTLQAQDTLHINVRAGEYDREYILYVPKGYSPQKPAGLMVCLHGFNRTMDDFFNDYNIAPVADSLNMIILAPQALPEQDPAVVAKAASLAALGYDIPLNAVWGCGLEVTGTLYGILMLSAELNKPVDDAAFINQIVQTTRTNYVIESKNQFIFGTSMGGFMSYQYALDHGDDLAGLVSVCGSMGTKIKNQSAAVTLPICDFHSQDDEVVFYTGSHSQDGITVRLAQPKPDVINLWVAKNKAVTTPVQEEVHYYPSNNGKTVTKFTYSHPTDEVIHYQIHGASHSYYFRKENGDCMDYNEEVYKFLAAHTWKSSTGILPFTGSTIQLYPNPVHDQLVVNAAESQIREVVVTDINGRMISRTQPKESVFQLSTIDWASGVYIVRITTERGVEVKKIIKK